MPIHIGWEDGNQTILRCHLEGRWNWEEFHAATEQAIALLQQVEHETYIIMDTTPCRGMPRTSPFPHFDRALRALPPTVMALIAIANRSFPKMILSVFNRFYGDAQPVQVVESLDDAYSILIEHHSEHDYKQHLLTEIASFDNARTQEAIEVFRQHEWLYDGTLNGLKLVGANLQDTDLFMGNFQGANLRGGNLKQTNLFMANFAGANLAQANLQRANCNEANFAGTVLYEAILVGADFVASNLDASDLRRANLRGAIFNGASMRGVSLIQASIDDAQLTEANLQNADLTMAVMRRVRLEGARLTKADLSDTYITGGDLTQANLQYATLRGARLQTASLYEADLRGANLLEADLQQATLDAARFDTTTIMPDGRNWNAQIDLMRFTHPTHPLFWRPHGQRPEFVDEDETIPARDMLPDDGRLRPR